MTETPKYLKKCCQPGINLVSETFSRLKLKDEQFKVYEPSSHKEINKFFTDVDLNEILKPKDTMTKFPQRPELSQYLSHCTWKRTYFVSIKKCGSRDCSICKPKRLNDQDLKCLNVWIIYPTLSLVQMTITKSLVKVLVPKRWRSYAIA